MKIENNYNIQLEHTSIYIYNNNKKKTLFRVMAIKMGKFNSLTQ